METVMFFFLVSIFFSWEVQAERQVPCYFIFGDSLVDNGNNNDFASLAKANYPPYGIDFPGGPSGRFSNGLTTVDVIAELLGFENFIPPFATTSGLDLLGGVNFASAAAGIRDETGRQLGDRTTANGQIQNYRAVVQKITQLLGSETAATNHLSKCIFSISFGGNDYLNNYFMPAFYSTGSEMTPEQFADDLVHKYREQLVTLYNNGARKVAIIGLGQVGCSPNEIARFSVDGETCVERINSAVRLFNDRLVPLVSEFNTKLSDAKFTYINAYKIFQDILNNPTLYGFSNINSGCCGVGRNNGQITCLPLQTPCITRNQYVFFDAFHPSEAANIILGKRIYSAQTPLDSFPVDIHTLALL